MLYYIELTTEQLIKSCTVYIVMRLYTKFPTKPTKHRAALSWLSKWNCRITTILPRERPHTSPCYIILCGVQTILLMILPLKIVH